MNLIAFDGLPLWNYPPELVLFLLFAALYGSARLIMWRRGGLTPEQWIPTLREGLLPFALLELIVIRGPQPAEAWYGTVWWHLACLVAVFIGAGWLQEVRICRICRRTVTLRGQRNDIELVRTVVYALFAYCVLALAPHILLSNEPFWVGPVYALLLGGLIALAWDSKPILRFADWLENYEFAR